jgi:hypothetical protein
MDTDEMNSSSTGFVNKRIVESVKSPYLLPNDKDGQAIFIRVLGGKHDVRSSGWHGHVPDAHSHSASVAFCFDRVNS